MHPLCDCSNNMLTRQKFWQHPIWMKFIVQIWCCMFAAGKRMRFVNHVFKCKNMHIKDGNSYPTVRKSTQKHQSMEMKENISYFTSKSSCWFYFNVKYSGIDFNFIIVHIGNTYSQLLYIVFGVPKGYPKLTSKYLSSSYIQWQIITYFRCDIGISTFSSPLLDFVNPNS